MHTARKECVGIASNAKLAFVARVAFVAFEEMRSERVKRVKRVERVERVLERDFEQAQKATVDRI
jgi:hypothetical protein